MFSHQFQPVYFGDQFELLFTLNSNSKILLTFFFKVWFNSDFLKIDYCESGKDWLMNDMEYNSDGKLGEIIFAGFGGGKNNEYGKSIVEIVNCHFTVISNL